MSRFSPRELARHVARLRRNLGLFTGAERAWLMRISIAIAALPEPTGSVFRMVRSGLGYAETGAQLGLSEHEVEGHMARALRLLAAVPRRERPP